MKDLLLLGKKDYVVRFIKVNNLLKYQKDLLTDASIAFLATSYKKIVKRYNAPLDSIKSVGPMVRAKPLKNNISLGL